MKKITFLFSLLLTFLGVSSAWAQNFHVSDAPNGSDWGTHTYWYTIKNADGGAFVSISNADANGMTLTTTSLSNTDEEKWCVVGSETEGYRFYNKAAGTSKVLGITNKNNNNTYGSSRANMVEYTSTSVSSTADNEVGFTFIRMNSSYDSHYEAFKLAGIEGNNQRYINKRGDYLSYWNHNNVAQGTSAGSSFLFTPVDEYEKALLDAKMKLEDASSFIGVVFGCTQESYDAALAIYNQYKNLDQYSVENKDAATAALKGISFTTLNMTDGMQVILGNKQHTNLYVFAKETNRNGVKGGHLGSGSAKDSYRYLFTFKDAGDGKFKIYSNYYDKYVGGVPNANDLEFQLVDAESAQAFTVKASANNLGYGSIYDENTTTTSGSVVVNALHMVNWNNNPAGNGVVRWEASAPASTFKFIPVTSEITGAWDAAIIKKASNVNNYIGYNKSNESVVAATKAFKAANAETKVSAYKALESALTEAGILQPVAGKYYTIQCVRGTHNTHYLTEGYGMTEETDSKNSLLASDLSSNIMPALWQFEQLTETNKTDRYYIKAANSLSYLSKTNGTGYRLRLLDAESTDKGEYVLTTATNIVNVDFAVALNDKVSNGMVSCRNENNQVVAWNGGNDGSSNNFLIKEVTEIPVSISAVGYATLNLPCAVTIPTDVKAYTATDGETEVTLSEITNGVIPAKTPVILVGTEGIHNFTIQTENTTAAITPNALKGTLVPTAVATDASAYILKKGAQGIGMYKITSETDRTIAANKAYMGSTAGASASNVKTFNFGGTSTGINNVVVGNAKNNVYYDLNGRRVLYPAHGVFVKANGEKVYIK